MKNRSWIPGRDADFHNWFENLVNYVVEKTTSVPPVWTHIPQAEVTKLVTAFTNWSDKYQVVLGPHTHPDVVAKRIARNEAEAILRPFRARFLDWEPVTDDQRAAVQVPTRDREPTNIGKPLGMPTATISYEGPGLLCLHFSHLAGTPEDEKADYGYRYYWGILPPGGASIEDATGPDHLLMHPPTQGAELPNSKFVKRQKEHLDFTGHNGSTAYFSIRYENDKGEPGPFCPVFSAIIP